MMLPMRTCAECGGTVEVDGVCPHCDAPAPWPPVPNPRTSVPPMRQWADPAPAPPVLAVPKRQPRLAVVIGVIVAVLVIAAVAGFVITHNDSHAPPPPPSAAAVTYRSQDGVVSARMPVAPQVTSLPAPVNGLVAIATQPTYARLFLEVHPGAVAASQIRSTLRSHVSIAVSIAGATVKSTREMTFRGLPAVRGTGTFRGDPLQFLAFSANGVEYGLVVHSRYFAAAQMKIFEDSVQVRRR